VPVLKLEHLDEAGFAPFGEVIEMRGDDWSPINNGSARRYRRFGTVRVGGNDAFAGISLVLGQAFDFPLTVTMLERHVLGSQSWMSCNGTPFIAVVAPDGADDWPDEAHIRAFYVEGNQGVNYHPGTWHHPLLALYRPGNFIVVDRISATPDCDTCALTRSRVIDGSFIG
jgi:ureidoglycolate lyase